MASSRRVLLRLQGDSGDARRAVADVRSDLRRMSREEFETRIDIQTARAERALKKVQGDLDNWRKQKLAGGTDPKIDVNIAKAEEKIALISLKIDRLSLKKANIDVDIKRGGLERAAAATGTLERGIGNVVRGFGDGARAIPIFGQIFATVLNGAISAATALGSALASLVSSGIQTLSESVGALSKLGSLAGPIGSVVGSLVGLAAQGALVAAILGGLVIALNAVLGAVIALAGALVALVASLTAAVAGLGALAVAFGGVLIPVVAVAIGLFTRFAAIIKARQAREQELAQSVQASKTAEEQRKTALDATKTAHERLAESVVEGRRAMAQAAIDERNAELSLANSQLGLKSARLGVLEAKKELRDLLKAAGAAGTGLDHLLKQFSDVHVDPTNLQSVLAPAQSAGATKNLDPLALQRAILNVQIAQQGVKNAVNDTANAERNLGEATRKRVDFAKKGLEAYKPYRQALEQVRKAEVRLAKAQDTTTAAQRKYEKALKGLSNTEKGSLTRLDEFLKKFKELAKAFTDPIFKALNETFDSLKGSGDGLKSALTQVGTAFGGVVRTIGAFLKDPRTQSAFKTMASGAADLARTLGGRAFGAFLTIMREVAIKALPAVRHAAHDVANALEGVASKPGRIRSVVGTLIGQFQTWSRLAGSLIGLVAEIFVPASKEGQNLADSMRHVVDHFREWVRSEPGQKKISEFFRTSVKRAKEIVKWIKDAVKWLKDHLPEAAAKAKDALGTVYDVLKAMKDTWKFMLDNPIGNAVGLGEGASGGGREARSDILPVFDRAKNAKVPKDQRITLALSLLELEISVNMRKKLVAILKGLGFTYAQALKRGYSGPKFAAGGLVPGSGRGDIVPAMLEPGEFVLNRRVTNALGLNLLTRLNRGIAPESTPTRAGAASVIHHHYEIKAPAGKTPDPVAAITKIHNLVVLKG